MTGVSDPALPERRQPHQRGSPTASDWEHHRNIITLMYRDHPLKEVVSIMAAEHNFFATERMYKTRISQWHLNKNMKSHEMETLMRDVQEGASAGKDAAVALRFGGKVVPWSKLERFTRRHKKDLTRARSPSAMTPDKSNASSPSISNGYTLLSIVEKDVELPQPPTNNQSEKVTSRETVDNAFRSSSTFNPLLRQSILNGPLVESPGQDVSSFTRVMDDTSMSGALVSVNSSRQNPAAESSRTSISHIRQQGDGICRCKIHTDACDRSQFAFGTENCTTCQRYFSWTTNALPYIITSQKGFICRCKWHDRACRKLQEDYDARKCACCHGWFAFSEQANHLIKTPAHTDIAYWNAD
jgi:hypothetical protein